MKILDFYIEHIDNENILCLFVEYQKSNIHIQCSNFDIIASHVFGKIHFRNLMSYSQICLLFFILGILLQKTSR